MTWVPEGGYWDTPSLAWGREAGAGDTYTNLSPLGKEIQTVKLLSRAEVDSLFAQAGPLSTMDLAGPTESLRFLIKDKHEELEACLRITTGFSLPDCREVLEGCDSFLTRFHHQPPAESGDFENGGRAIGIRSVPWGTVATILPQNAFITTALICLLSALATGNRVILRAPSGSARLAGILGRLIAEAGFPGDRFSMVLCDAGQFVEAWASSKTPSLLHYMGSSGRAPELLSTAFRAGRHCLVDGEGNVWVYIDADQDPDQAASLVWQGAIRYNGQTCTSVNGVVVHPDVDTAVRWRLRELAAVTTFGVGVQDQVGPVFSVGQAAAAQRSIGESNGRIGRRGILTGNLLPPTLVEDPSEQSELVGEGLFGPAMWIRTGDYREFLRLWPLNRYPLGAAILSHQIESGSALSELTGASRVVFNGDPSLEDPMEPWGAYPACGSNPVSNWPDKYLRPVQIDRAV